MNICVVGTGYVGLVTGSCFAESGNNVVCVDKDEPKVAQLSRGEPTIHEPGLPELLKRNLEEGRLSFTTDLPEAVRQASAVFIAVGTPFVDGHTDLSAVRAVALAIGEAMNEFKVIITKSTVPAGTNEEIGHVIRSVTSERFAIVSNPEFLKEGSAVDDFMKPDRVVVGTHDKTAVKMLKSLYAPFVRTGKPILVTDIRTAEMAKYASNAYLATRVSFMNDFANLCERVGADVETVRKIMGLDVRIGSAFLFPGIGFGGSCFPKDIDALIETGHSNEYPLRILTAVKQVNHDQRSRFLEKIFEYFGGELYGKRIAVWGLAFKPRTDDMREAPSVDIIEGLIKAGASVSAYDPAAGAQARSAFGSGIEIAEDHYSCLESADALLVLTEWQVFRNPSFARMHSAMRSHAIFDGRNIFEPEEVRIAGFDYYGVGRGFDYYGAGRERWVEQS